MTAAAVYAGVVYAGVVYADVVYADVVYAVVFVCVMGATVCACVCASVLVCMCVGTRVVSLATKVLNLQTNICLRVWSSSASLCCIIVKYKIEYYRQLFKYL